MRVCPAVPRTYGINADAALAVYNNRSQWVVLKFDQRIVFPVREAHSTVQTPYVILAEDFNAGVLNCVVVVLPDVVDTNNFPPCVLGVEGDVTIGIARRCD